LTGRGSYLVTGDCRHEPPAFSRIPHAAALLPCA